MIDLEARRESALVEARKRFPTDKDGNPLCPEGHGILRVDADGPHCGVCTGEVE